MTHSSARRPGAALWISALLTLAACTTPAGPPASLAAAQSAIDAARAEGAGDPGSPAVAHAQGKLERARQLAPADRLRAHRLAEEAASDADLVRAQASNQRSQQALAEVRRSLQTLGDELQRGAASPAGPAASR